MASCIVGCLQSLIVLWWFSSFVCFYIELAVTLGFTLTLLTYVFVRDVFATYRYVLILVYLLGLDGPLGFGCVLWFVIWLPILIAFC